jgi:gamma-glutamyltranspeptidase/glutathione hydrolase
MRHRRAVLLLILAATRGVAAEETPREAIVAPHPMAEAAAREMLHAGGSASDAAIAAQMMLAVVAPESSGLGGGAAALHFDGASHEVSGWDGRETAPAGVTSDLFARQPAIGGRSVGVPGTVRMLEALHHEHGHLPWADLLAPAITAVEAGIPVSDHLAEAIAAHADGLRRQPAARSVFFAPDGTPLLAGATLLNPALAQTLRGIATSGATALMRGPVAADIATTVRTDEQPGLLTTDDLAAYAAIRRAPVCLDYRGRTVCADGPPAGGTQVLEALGLLERFELGRLDPAGPDVAELLAEAERLASADRARYLADPDFAPAPALLDPAYIRFRAQLIDPRHAAASVLAGALAPPGQDAPPAAPLQPESGTDTITVTDAAGNVVCLTSSIGPAFGSGLVVRGMALNAALADFAPQPTVDGRPVANRVEPGKRPATSLTGLFILASDGRLYAVLGSAREGNIAAQLVQAVTGLLDWPPPAEARTSSEPTMDRAEPVAVQPALATAPGKPGD